RGACPACHGHRASGRESTRSDWRELMTQSTEDWQTTAALIGPRAERAPDPIRVINESTELLKELRTPNRSAGGTFAELKGRYASACRTYFTAAAVSRR